MIYLFLIIFYLLNLCHQRSIIIFIPMQKQQLIQACHSYLKEKINALHVIISEATESSNSESKSSAGDKHETSKAMIQLEIEKLGTQLKEAEEQLSEFDKIDFSKLLQQVGQGSLIETNRGVFLVASSIGKLEVNGKLVFVISNRSPLAIALSGKKQNDEVLFNGVGYKIESIN
jgi:transcription elongation GreA/GreB family factor